MTGAAARVLDAGLEATVAGGFSSIGYRARRAMGHWEDPPRMDGKFAVVTGATSGIGKAAALQLTALGAGLLLVGRNQQRLDEVLAEAAAARRGALGEPGAHGTLAPEPPLVGVRADLSERAGALAVVDAARSASTKLDVLVHNAGALVHDRRHTADGFEQTYACQVLSPFLITAELLPELRAADDPRVIVVASGGMYAERLDVSEVQSLTGDYDGVRAYAKAKRAQVELNRLWARACPDVTFAAMHPGWAETPGVIEALPGFTKVTRPILRTPAEGADTIVWLAATDDDLANGEFWLDRHPRGTVRLPWTRTPAGAPEELWRVVSEQTGVSPA